MASSKVMASTSPPNRDHPRQPSPSRLNLHSDQSRGLGSMNIDDILRNIYSDSESIVLEDSSAAANGESSMTLEDFLAKAGAVDEDEVRVSAAAATPAAAGGFGMDAANMVHAAGVPAVHYSPAMEEFPIDKATQQKQKRMIKNRESAARSRERKQAYTVELETLVTQLEEENAKLLEDEAELNKERYKQLMENLIPVVEKRRPKPPRVIRRVQSMEW
ncbi:hypothetical protein MIMGU_mgv1a013542mg [Erythranthe guttata]|uniref:BZIP domain-containing protein n=1 Tax=Erythranthe guttata TaxID=4155 RepID=A0A022PRZ2_ERYGU|nr:hypothetical protein MIMGU_mgv1a013542mg [Erythranthe guttata]